MYLCQPEFSIMLHNLCIITWNMGVSMWQIVCFVVILLLYMHQYMNLCPPDCPCWLLTIWTVSWKHGWPRVALCVCHNQPISGHSPLLECVHASIHCISVHLTLYFIFIPLCKVTWKDVCPCVLLCDYSSNPTFSPTPWLACVHASVHVLLSTWLPISASPH